MNQLCASVVFEEEPKENTKQLVFSELRVLLALFTANEIEFKCGKGSWWVHTIANVVQVAAIWVALETLSWAMGKFLDGDYDEQESEHRVSEAVIVQDDARSSPSYGRPVLLEGEGAAERTRAVMENLRTVFETTGANAVTFSEWSDEVRMGRIIEFSRGPAGTTFSFHQTDSREEFNIRTNPAFRVK